MHSNVFHELFTRNCIILLYPLNCTFKFKIKFEKKNKNCKQNRLIIDVQFWCVNQLSGIEIVLEIIIRSWCFNYTQKYGIKWRAKIFLRYQENLIVKMNKKEFLHCKFQFNNQTSKFWKNKKKWNCSQLKTIERILILSLIVNDDKQWEKNWKEKISRIIEFLNAKERYFVTNCKLNSNRWSLKLMIWSLIVNRDRRIIPRNFVR